MIMAMKPTHVVLIATGIMVALYLQAAMLFTLLFLKHFRHLYQLPAFVEMFAEFLGVPVSYCTETLADNAIFHTHFRCSLTKQPKTPSAGNLRRLRMSGGDPVPCADRWNGSARPLPDHQPSSSTHTEGAPMISVAKNGELRGASHRYRSKLLVGPLVLMAAAVAIGYARLPNWPSAFGSSASTQM